MKKELIVIMKSNEMRNAVMVNQILTAAGPMLSRVGNANIQKSVKNAKDV